MLKQNKPTKVKQRKVKAWITVSDFSLNPTTYGEYFTKKEPEHYTEKVIPCTITYSLPTKVTKKK